MEEKDTQHTQQQQLQEDLDICPSFSCYTSGDNSNNIAEIAARVAAETRNGEEEVEDGFEFAFKSEVLSEAGPVYPVFNRDLAIGHGCGGEVTENIVIENKIDLIESRPLVPLGKLLLQAREEKENNDSCSSSSEADELENIPAGSYCVWRPKAAETPSPSRCKKSKSTGSASKRWKFRDFMRRSNSDGKDSFVFLTPKQKESSSKGAESPKRVAAAKGKGGGVGGSGGGARWSPSAHEALYVRNRAAQEGNRRKSYLPYRRDLVGFFANVTVLGKSFPHF